MNLPLLIAAAFAAGLVLGALFYGGLWLTMQRLPKARHPGLLMLASFWGRSLLAVAGFYFSTGGQWPRLIACLAGFVTMRVVLTIWFQPERPAVKAAAEKQS